MLKWMVRCDAECVCLTCFRLIQSWVCYFSKLAWSGFWSVLASCLCPSLRLHCVSSLLLTQGNHITVVSNFSIFTHLCSHVPFFFFSKVIPKRKSWFPESFFKVQGTWRRLEHIPHNQVHNHTAQARRPLHNHVFLLQSSGKGQAVTEISRAIIKLFNDTQPLLIQCWPSLFLRIVNTKFVSNFAAFHTGIP